MSICAVKGWGITGSRSDAYRAEIVAERHDGEPVVRVWRAGDGSDGFGGRFQIFRWL